MLPIVKQPKYKTIIDEVGSIEYRPMLNHEYKAISTAIDIGDDFSIVTTMLDIVKSCTFGKVNPCDFPGYVIEYMFLQIFIKSVENKISATYTCGNNVVDPEDETQTIKCGQSFNLVIPIEEAKVKFPENFKDKSVIKIDSNNSIEFKSHTFDDIIKFEELSNNATDEPQELSLDDRLKNGGRINKDEIDVLFTYMGLSKVITSTGTLTKSDFTIDEYKQWYDTLPVQTIADITKFYGEQPHLYYEHQTKCIKCGHVHTSSYNGLQSFFN